MIMKEPTISFLDLVVYQNKKETINTGPRLLLIAWGEIMMLSVVPVKC